MVNTEIRLIIFFAAKDGEALYSQKKQVWELTVVQIINSLFLAILIPACASSSPALHMMYSMYGEISITSDMQMTVSL